MDISEKRPSSQKTSTQSKENVPNFIKHFRWIVPLLLILWLCWPTIVSWWSTPCNEETAKVTYADIGCFGDLFGSFNALVSMLAFIGFIYALHLQRVDLQLQRTEMKQSRMEMGLQTVQYQEQTNILRQQNEENKQHFQLQDFTNNLYQRISLVRELLSEVHLEFSHNGKLEHYKGSKAIDEMHYRLCDIARLVFPHNDDQQREFIPEMIAWDCLQMYNVFLFTSSFCTNFCDLIDDICKEFNEDLKNKKRFIRIATSSVNVNCLGYIYAVHDTYFQSKYIAHIANNRDFISIPFANIFTKDRRIALHNLFEDISDVAETHKNKDNLPKMIADHIIQATNNWRNENKLPPIIPWSPMPGFAIITDGYYGVNMSSLKQSKRIYNNKYIDISNHLSISGNEYIHHKKVLHEYNLDNGESITKNSDQEGIFCYVPFAVHFQIG